MLTWLCTFCRHEISSFYRQNRIVARQVDLIEDAPEVRAALESLSETIVGPDTALDRIRIQSMTTTDTLDTQATVAQTERLVDAGCEIVRITAPGKREAAVLDRLCCWVHRCSLLCG